MTLDLPLIWGVLIAVAVLLYVVADGFDLGVGILFPFAADPKQRDAMMNTVAPYWDGNETWLVLGGGGLMAAFPAAYSVLLPAFYLPVLLMLVALVLRGVAFEFRFRAGSPRGRLVWGIAFSGGSLAATLAQGLILGGFVQGVTVRGDAFAGRPLDWLTPYTLLLAVGLVAGYAFLGATWATMKSEGALHQRARRWAWVAGTATAGLLAAVSLATLYIHPQVAARWGIEGGVDVARLAPRLPIPILGLAGLAVAAAGLARGAHRQPFVGAVLVFLSGYLGLAAGFVPYVVPYALTFRDAASADNALALLLGGVAIMLPVILGYSAYVYWVFRGKVGDEGYH